MSEGARCYFFFFLIVLIYCGIIFQFFPLAGDPKELMAHMVKHPGLMPGSMEEVMLFSFAPFTFFSLFFLLDSFIVSLVFADTYFYRFPF